MANVVADMVADMEEDMVATKKKKGECNKKKRGIHAKGVYMQKRRKGRKGHAKKKKKKRVMQYADKKSNLVKELVNWVQQQQQNKG